MSGEDSLPAARGKATNDYEDVRNHFEVSDSMKFLFTSESVGEGHPGKKIDLNFFSPAKLTM